MQLQLAASALNVFNMTNFLPGGSNIGLVGFGQITSAYRDISGTVDQAAASWNSSSG